MAKMMKITNPPRPGENPEKRDDADEQKTTRTSDNRPSTIMLPTYKNDVQSSR